MLKRLLLTSLLFYIWLIPIQAQLLDPVSFHITDFPEEVKAGERFTITVRAEIEGEWHLYSALNDPDAGPYPTTFTPVSDGLMSAGEITETEPRIVLDPNFNAKLGWHSREALFNIPVVFDISSQGARDAALDILYQVCDDRSCLPPKTKQVSASLLIQGVSESPYIPEQNSGMTSYFKEQSWLFRVIIIAASVGAMWYLIRRNSQRFV